MGNLYTTITRSTLLVNKLREIISQVQNSSTPVGNNTYQTYDDVAAEVYSSLSKFYRNISDPILVAKSAIERTDPELDDFNQEMKDILSDLNVLFNEFENLEDVVLGGWNFMVSRSNNLKSHLKQSASRLADYFLYSSIKTGNYFFITDSFNNIERVESRSPLLKEPDELLVHQEEGILTLPLDTTYSEQKITTSKTPVVNASSNGSLGNNHQYSSSINFDLLKIVDYNPDTWFEYERVVSPNDGVALILDMTINLEEDQIINFIKINPNNFGAKTELEVLNIETSIDGNTFEDIKEDLLAPDIVDQNTGSLKISVSTSKFAGQGFYSFFPRRARYIHIALKQSTPYKITTFLGQEKWRYAIGIRDIWIERRKYKEKGELISKTYSFSEEIRKLLLESEQSPLQSAIDEAGSDNAIVNMSHSISSDNGVSWHSIRPKESTGLAGVIQEVPELLDFNGVSTDTITTKTPVSSLRYRVHMARNSGAFQEDTSKIKQKEVLITELHQAPTITPFNISLQNMPIVGSVKIIDPFLGSRGMKTYKYIMKLGSNDESRIVLPFAPISPELEKSWDGSNWQLSEVLPLNISVDGVPWSRGLLSAAGSSDKYYQINITDGCMTFGNNITGKAPGQGALIEAYLTEERLFPSVESTHIAQLKYPLAPDSEEVELYLVRPMKTRTKVLGKGSKIHQLDKFLDSNYTLIFSDTTVFQTSETFVDGGVELTSAGDYSIDHDSGIVYSYSSTVGAGETTVSYKFTPREQVSSSRFSFTDINGGVSNGIAITKEGWTTFPIDDPETVPTGEYYFNLGNLSIAKGSVKFSGTNVSTIFKKEVPFVDGRTELLGVQRTTQKLSSITMSAPGTTSIALTLQISAATDLEVAFSNKTVFATKKTAPGDVSSNGDYYIYRTAGDPRILLYLDNSVSDPGYVSYFFSDPNADLDGAYSINYERGEVYTHTQTIAELSVNYRYIDYRICYPIARVVKDNDFSIDAKNKLVEVKDREILKKSTVERGKASQDYYRVSYKYLFNPTEAISEFEEFYTPVLSSYKLKIVPQSKLAY